MAITLDRKILETNFPRSAATGRVHVAAEGKLEITVSVADRYLRDSLQASQGKEAADTFDGLERPVALVPTQSGVARYPLSYVGTSPASGMAPDVDHYRLLIDAQGFDLAAAITQGVRLLLETNRGDIRLQSDEDAYPAIVSG